MLLRFLQKGLTFHNIPLMLGITAQDDENVVYSKQIGVEENNGKAKRGPTELCSSPRRGEQSAPVGSPSLNAPWFKFRPGLTEGIGSDRDSTHPALAGSQGVTVAIVHGGLLSARQNVSGCGLQHHPVTSLFPF